MTTLVAISYSPWSEKARWALEHHRLRYRKVEYLPMLGEPVLRAALGKITGKVSVPVLFADGAIEGSWDIAKFASREEPSFLADEAVTSRWNDRSDRLLNAGRIALMARLLADPDAQREALPPAIPRPIREKLRPLARQVMRFVADKYRGNGDDADPDAAMREVAGELREALGGRDHLLGDRFTYADAVMAVSLQMVKPVDQKFLKLGRATRKAWTHPVLSEELADLLAWRDRIYERHRHL